MIAVAKLAMNTVTQGSWKVPHKCKRERSYHHRRSITTKGYVGVVVVVVVVVVV